MSTDTTGQQERTAYVIVGGGLAAAKAIEGIRESDTTGAIVLVTEEDRLPYERPPLSKSVLKGEEEMETAFTHDRDWYTEQGVELRLASPATSLDAEQHALTLAGGDVLPYERLLIATGSSARALDALAEAELHAMTAVEVREPAADLLPHDAEERSGLRLDDGHDAAGIAGGGGDLEADPPGADDDDA